MEQTHVCLGGVGDDVVVESVAICPRHGPELLECLFGEGAAAVSQEDEDGGSRGEIFWEGGRVCAGPGQFGHGHPGRRQDGVEVVHGCSLSSSVALPIDGFLGMKSIHIYHRVAMTSDVERGRRVVETDRPDARASCRVL